MNETLLVASHLLSFIAGAAVTWRLMVRKLRVREYDGHLGLEVKHPDD